MEHTEYHQVIFQSFLSAKFQILAEEAIQETQYLYRNSHQKHHGLSLFLVFPDAHSEIQAFSIYTLETTLN